MPRPSSSRSASRSDSRSASRSDSRRRGRPPLRCNLWLEEQIAALPNRRYFWHLYEEWLQRYISEQGRPPTDPRHSFREAATSCLDRLHSG